MMSTLQFSFILLVEFFFFLYYIFDIHREVNYLYILTGRSSYTKQLI